MMSDFGFDCLKNLNDILSIDNSDNNNFHKSYGIMQKDGSVWVDVT